MYIDFSQLLSADYLFDKNPGGDFLLGFPLLIFFFLVLFSKSFLKVKASSDKYFKKSIKKKFGRFVALGIVGLVLTAARFSAVPVISMRFVLYLVFILTLLTLFYTCFQIRKEYKKRLSSVEREKIKREL